MKIPTAASLAPEYFDLFNRCTPHAEAAAEIKALATRIVAHQDVYQRVAAKFSNGLPWFAIALIHAMEADLSFARHLHNGDPLARKTVNVPANRPPGAPPWTWEESAVDALKYDHWNDAPSDQWKSVAGVLYEFEEYNGFGPRLYHNARSAYLWSGSSVEQRGKYVADGKWDPDARSSQIGAAVILKELVTAGQVAFEAAPPSTGSGPSAPAETPPPQSPTLQVSPSAA